MDSCSNACHAVFVHARSFLLVCSFHGVNLEADIFERSVIENDPPVKEEGWIHERVIALEAARLRPLRLKSS